MFDLVLDTLRATTPIIAKVFLTWLVNVYTFHHFDGSGNPASPPDKPQGVGFGIGLALALFAMQGGLYLPHVRYGMMLLIPVFLNRGGQFGITFFSKCRSRS